MFICKDKCIKAYLNRGISISIGSCEICGEHKPCYDIPSSRLEPVKVEKVETWSDRFNAFMAEWLRSKGYDVREVTSVSSDFYERGGCPTCGPEYTYETDISWVDNSGKNRYKSFDVRLEDLF